MPDEQLNRMADSRTEQRAFPRLTDDQIRRLEPYGSPEHYQAGEFLFKEGDGDFGLFVIRQGSVRIIEHSSGEEKLVTVHQPGEFTGDVDTLSGQASLVAAVAETDCDVLHLEAGALHEVINAHSDLSDLLLEAFLTRRSLLLEAGFTGLRVIGSRWSSDTFRIRDFLARNHIPFTWVDIENDERVSALLEQLKVSSADTPIILRGNGEVLRNPKNEALAEACGLATTAEKDVYDLVVVGAGPAGLAAAVYGASEGLQTLVLEANAPGGQASWSSKIENYLGFPTGLSGAELAERAVLQAEKFGAALLTGQAERLTANGKLKTIVFNQDQEVTARCVVIATGASYRRLEVENVEAFEGSSVHYSATAVEAITCRDYDVAVVGGGNSAGQAAVFLARSARCVHLIVRGETLGDKMSRYLVDRIKNTENISLALNADIITLHGETGLEALTIRNRKDGSTTTIPAASLFVFIGADPHTTWLEGTLELDAKGFIKTGNTLSRFDPGGWPIRQPYLLETSLPGVFAAGDVRSDSIKRVASAVGEGSMAISFVHQVLAE
jgi:thioredoxin reductase (NADPH)